MAPSLPPREPLRARARPAQGRSIMKRAVSLLVAGATIGLAGCILDFDGLSGGVVRASCPECGLCEGGCDGELCSALIDVAPSYTVFRVAIAGGALFTSDPGQSSVVRFTQEEGAATYKTPTTPHAIAVNDQYVFWSTEGDGIYRCEQAGCGKLVKIAAGDVDTAARQMAADASS